MEDNFGGVFCWQQELVRNQTTELVVKGSKLEEIERVRVNDYESGILRREELRRKYNPREVIFVLEKYLE